MQNLNNNKKRTKTATATQHENDKNNNSKKKKKKPTTLQLAMRWHFTVDMDQLDHHRHQTSLAARGQLFRMFVVQTSTATATKETFEGTLTWNPSGASGLALTVRGSKYSEPGVLILICDMRLFGGGDEVSPVTSVILKMRAPLDAFEDEMDRTRKMHASEQARALMPELYAFGQIRFPNGKTYGAICMQRLNYSATELLFPSLSIPCPNTIRDVLLRRARRFHAWSQQQQQQPSAADDEKHGMPMLAAADDDDDDDDDDEPRAMLLIARMQSAVLATCLRVLHRLHTAAGWCHGDSHLGNFLIDCETWRICLIDFERAFACTNNAVQWFLDDQELFGHASGMLRTEPRWEGWEMAHIVPLCAQLHPASARSQLKTAAVNWLTPICACFIHSNLDERLAGCDLCQSHLNRTTADQYYLHGKAEGVMAALAHNTVSLLQVRQSVRQAKRTLERTMRPIMRGLVRHHAHAEEFLQLFQRHHATTTTTATTATTTHSSSFFSPLFLDLAEMRKDDEENDGAACDEDRMLLRERLYELLYKPQLMHLLGGVEDTEASALMRNLIARFATP